MSNGTNWRSLAGLGSKMLNCLLAHDKNVKTACHEDKVRGLGAVWRDGHGDRVVPGKDERPKSTLSVANRVWLLPILVLFVLSTVSEHPLRHSSSASSPGVSGVRVPVLENPITRVTPSLAPSLRNSLLLSGCRLVGEQEHSRALSSRTDIPVAVSFPQASHKPPTSPPACDEWRGLS